MKTREIKFRAWDADEKEMYYGVGVTPLRVIIYEDVNGKMIPPKETGYIGIDRDELFLMQYTGMEINDDVQIYEGDILCGSDSEGYGPEAIHYTIKSVVSWDNEDGKWVVTEIGDEQKYDLYDYGLIDFVAGNIYQNPELLIIK